MAKTRTFVAIELESSLSRRVAGLIDRLRPYAPSARWVEEENLHLTLLFLGELSDQEVAEACSDAEWAARANQPFSMRLAGAGAFPDLARPRALWLGVSEGADPLKRLQADLDEALGHLVAKAENRPFIPHLTLARLNSSAGGRRSNNRRGGGTSPHLTEVLAGLADYDAGEQKVSELNVYSSELRREGPEYHVLARNPLGAPDPQTWPDEA